MNMKGDLSLQNNEPEREMMRVLNAMPYCVVVFDLENLRMLTVNDHAARMFGYEPGEKEATGGAWEENLYGEESTERVLQHFAEVKRLRDGETAEFVCRCKGKLGAPLTMRFVSSIIRRNEEGTPVRSVAVGLLASMPGGASPAWGIFQPERQASVLWEYSQAKSAITSLFGDCLAITGREAAPWYETKDLLAHVFAEDRSMVALLARSAAAQNTPFEFEFRLMREDKSLVWVRVNGVWRDTGVAAGTLVDVTRRTQFREDLQRTAMEGRLYSARLGQALEEEKRRHAQFLHDEVGQLAARVLMDAEWLTAEPKGVQAGPDQVVVNRADVDELRKHALLLLDAIRGQSHQLLPSILDTLELTASLEWLAKYYERKSSIKCSFRREGPYHLPRLTLEETTAIFRVAQEAMINAWRHARARSIEIILEEDEFKVEVHVRDDGVGMPVGGNAHSTNMGLRSMKERAAMIGATLVITSGDGKGTDVGLLFQRDAAARMGRCSI